MINNPNIKIKLKVLGKYTYTIEDFLKIKNKFLAEQIQHLPSYACIIFMIEDQLRVIVSDGQ